MALYGFVVTSYDGEQPGQFNKGGKVAKQPFDDEFPGQELFENLKPIFVKKIRKAKFQEDKGDVAHNYHNYCPSQEFFLFMAIAGSGIDTPTSGTSG